MVTEVATVRLPLLSIMDRLMLLLVVFVALYKLSPGQETSMWVGLLLGSILTLVTPKTGSS
jgi:uncharacterized BrkB/YihY/UPF0761 family membrane protein